MIQSISARLSALARDERGLSTVEYVVLLVLIVAVSVAAWQTFGSRVQDKLGQASTSFDSTVQAGAVGSTGGGAAAPAATPGVGAAVAE